LGVVCGKRKEAGVWGQKSTKKKKGGAGSEKVGGDGGWINGEKAGPITSTGEGDRGTLSTYTRESKAQLEKKTYQTKKVG